MSKTINPKQFIVIGNCLYKINAKEFKELKHIIDNGGEYYRGNQLVRTYEIGEFLEAIEKKYKPVCSVYGVYQS